MFTAVFVFLLSVLSTFTVLQIGVLIQKLLLVASLLSQALTRELWIPFFFVSVNVLH